MFGVSFVGGRLDHAGWLLPAWPVFAITLGREANAPSAGRLRVFSIVARVTFVRRLLDSDLHVVAIDLYAVEADFAVGLQSIESGFRIRFCAG